MQIRFLAHCNRPTRATGRRCLGVRAETHSQVRIDPDSLLHVADVDGRGKRRGDLHECKLTAVSTVLARPGPHDWGIQLGGLGLTQTRPALLPYAGALRGSEEPKI